MFKIGHKAQTVFAITLAFFLITSAGSLFAQTINPVTEDKAELENLLVEIEKQIEDQRKILQSKQRESTTLERDLAIIDTEISKSKLEIRARTLNIRGINGSIDKRTETIDELSARIVRDKNSLAELLRRTYELDSTSLVEVVLGYDQLSDFFIELDTFEFVQERMQVSFAEIRNTQSVIGAEKESLIGERNDEYKLKAVQEVEKGRLETRESKKNSILKVTKGEEKKYKEVLKATRKKAAEIRSRIFRLYGGGELPFGEAVILAEIVEDATGMRAAFVLAVLAQESAIDGVIGRNLGRCFYNGSASNKSGTVMKDNQKPSFLAIINELGLNPGAIPVSCPIPSDGAYGGAMGPAQFMPTTWWDINANTGYKKRIAKVTGNNPPSPFNNLDAFTGSALYLKDAYNSRACRNYAEKNKNISPKRLLGERCAAAKYYAGGNWYKFRWAYGEPVVERAAKFQKDIDILNR